MSSVLSIRVAAEGDVDDVMALVAACIGDMRARGIEQWDELYPDRATIAADVAAGTLHVAAVPGEPLAGVFTVDEHEDPRWSAAEWRTAGERVAVVHRLMVNPQLQGRGLARELMLIAEEHARQRGYGAIHLDCYSGNPQALRLYQRLGYRDAGGAALRKGMFRCLEKKLEVGSEKLEVRS